MKIKYKIAIYTFVPIFIFVFVAFCDCSNLPNIHLLPDPLAVSALIILPFITGASIVRAAFLYFNLVKGKHGAPSGYITAGQAYLAIFGFLFFLILLIEASHKYCR